MKNCIRTAAERLARAKRSNNTIAVMRYEHRIERFRLQLEDIARVHRICTEGINLSAVQDSEDILVTEEHVQRTRRLHKDIRDDWHSDFVLLRHTLSADRRRVGPWWRVHDIVMFAVTVLTQVPFVLCASALAKRLERNIRAKFEAQKAG